MSTRLSPAPSDFADGRWPDERTVAHRADPRGPDPRTMDLRTMEPPLHPSEREHYESEFDQFENQRQRWSPGRQVAAALGRFLTIFCIGIAATLVWQSYSNAARRMVAGLSPKLVWLAPSQPAPAVSLPSAPSAGSAFPDQLAAISRSLSVVRQSVDKLAADITRLQTAKPDIPPVRTPGPQASAPPPAAGAAPGRKPAPAAQTSAAR
jgi:hypothetical protein